MCLWLSSGLWLGWAVGANIAANVFATAVASRMLRLATVVKLSVIFIILGGLVNGPAAMETVSRLGGIDSLTGAFTVALASAATITFMSAAGLPISAAQTGVGALIGYQFFYFGGITAQTQPLLRTVILAWICAPTVSAAVAFIIYKITAQIFRRLPMPLFLMDQWIRLGLVVVGCYGAWAFGGNNMANVVGFYMEIDLISPVHVWGWTISQARILALMGGLAIGLGIASYSHRIMLMVGRDLVQLDGITAFIATLAQAIVVDFLAHSWEFGTFVLPAIPVSISQALVGAVLGPGMARGIQTIKLNVFGNIVIGWLFAPLISGGLTYLLLPLLMSSVR